MGKAILEHSTWTSYVRVRASSSGGGTGAEGAEGAVATTLRVGGTEMASDDQWSGLLLVVIMVAIFSIVSVSGMAVYFFCKCKKDKRKRTQIRPTIRGGIEEQEEEGVLFQRGRQPNDSNWATVEEADSTHVPIIGRNYLAPRRGNVNTDFQEQRVHVDTMGNYDASNFKSHTRQNISSRLNKTSSTNHSNNLDIEHIGEQNYPIRIGKREQTQKGLENISNRAEMQIENIDTSRTPRNIDKDKMQIENIDTSRSPKKIEKDKMKIENIDTFRSPRNIDKDKMQIEIVDTSRSPKKIEKDKMKIENIDTSRSPRKIDKDNMQIENIDTSRSPRKIDKNLLKRRREKNKLTLIEKDDDLDARNQINIEEAEVSGDALRRIHLMGNRALQKQDLDAQNQIYIEDDEVSSDTLRRLHLTGNRALPKQGRENTQMEMSDDFQMELGTDNDNTISKSPRRVNVESRAAFRNPIEKIHSEKELMKNESVRRQSRKGKTYADNSGHVRPTKRKHAEGGSKISTPRRKNTEQRKTIKTFREVKTEDEDFLKIINAVSEYNHPEGHKKENTGIVTQDETGGLFIKPQRIKVRDSSSRESSISSSHDYRNNRASKREDENRASRTINTPIGGNPLIFTASSKMAWTFDR